MNGTVSVCADGQDNGIFDKRAVWMVLFQSVQTDRTRTTVIMWTTSFQSVQTDWTRT